jgi:hypothetical protein
MRADDANSGHFKDRPLIQTLRHSLLLLYDGRAGNYCNNPKRGTLVVEVCENVGVTSYTDPSGR